MVHDGGPKCWVFLVDYTSLYISYAHAYAISMRHNLGTIK